VHVKSATAPAMPVTTTFLGEMQQIVSLHGYWVVGLTVGLESLGLPLPGETILVLAAIYAATEPSFNIWVVIAVAAFGAIIGDNIGYRPSRKARRCGPSTTRIVMSVRLDHGEDALDEVHKINVTLFIEPAEPRVLACRPTQR